jgi:DNA-binding response OmpR family regulator
MSEDNNNTGIDLDTMRNDARVRVLIIDDEPDTVTLLKLIFQREGFNVAGALSGQEALQKLETVRPALILLDLMMPEMDGWDTFSRLRQLTQAPVIVISALSQSDHIVRALKMGADDYVTKPFNNAEVIARSQALLRRSGKEKEIKRMVFPAIEMVLDLDTQEVFYRGHRIQLTGKMFDVMLILAKSAPRVVSYDDITTQIWGETGASVRNRLKYLIYLLRQEFDAADGGKGIIKNIDRLGYKLLSE